jgi:EAL domain-containing protein (putative c-di-GMP-specific phosphodiesterase class I)
VRVAVNVSPRQIHGGHLSQVVADALRNSGIMPDRLQLEITEGLFMRDVDTTFRQLAELREFGIQILMDDFGTGYSSLSYFQRFTFDKVKIDQSFVRDVLTSRAAAAIIRAIVELGDALGMRVVAEGVETQGQMEELLALGCTHLQGYLFSPPVDAALHPCVGRVRASNRGMHRSLVADDPRRGLSMRWPTSWPSHPDRAPVSLRDLIQAGGKRRCYLHAIA